MGRIQQVLVREGDSVRAGRPWCARRCGTARAVEQAQAGVKAAQSQQAAAQTDAAWRQARWNATSS
jgi:Na+/alanine symporter